MLELASKEVYLTHRDKSYRTNVSVLVRNYPITSEIVEEIFPPHNGQITANHHVNYRLEGHIVLQRSCQIMLQSDKSEASLLITERHMAGALGNHAKEMIIITKEQFALLQKVWAQ